MHRNGDTCFALSVSLPIRTEQREMSASANRGTSVRFHTCKLSTLPPPRIRRSCHRLDLSTALTGSAGRQAGRTRCVSLVGLSRAAKLREVAMARAVARHAGSTRNPSAAAPLSRVRGVTRPTTPPGLPGGTDGTRTKGQVADMISP